jgi:phosphatidylglycerophosphate synthase
VIVSPQFYFWLGWIPLAIFGLGSYLDAIDGTVARETGTASNYGAFLDSTLDRASDAITLLGLILSGQIWPWGSSGNKINNLIGFLALVVIMLISYVRSRAEIEGVIMKGKGFMERAERVLFIVGIYLIDWIAFAIQTQYFGEWTLDWIFPAGFIIFTILCLQTLWVRFSWTYKWLNHKIPASTIEKYQKIASNSVQEEK